MPGSIIRKRSPLKVPTDGIQRPQRRYISLDFYRISLAIIQLYIRNTHQLWLIGYLHPYRSTGHRITFVINITTIHSGIRSLDITNLQSSRSLSRQNYIIFFPIIKITRIGRCLTSEAQCLSYTQFLVAGDTDKRRSFIYTQSHKSRIFPFPVTTFILKTPNVLSWRIHRNTDLRKTRPGINNVIFHIIDIITSYTHLQQFILIYSSSGNLHRKFFPFSFTSINRIIYLLFQIGRFINHQSG